MTIFNIVWSLLFLAIMAYIAIEIVRARLQNAAYQHLLEQALADSARTDAQTALKLTELLVEIAPVIKRLQPDEGEEKSP